MPSTAHTADQSFDNPGARPPWGLQTPQPKQGQYFMARPLGPWIELLDPKISIVIPFLYIVHRQGAGSA